MADEAKPLPVVLVHGKVLNSRTKKPVGTDISYYDLSTNREMGVAQSNPVDGSYKIVLPAGTVYSFLAKKGGFYSVSENINVLKLEQYTEIERNLFLAPLDVGEVIRLNNLFFEVNKADLNSESHAELDRLVKILLDNSGMRVEIAGHTDSQGADEHNLNLSRQRVNSVASYLESRGVELGRLEGKGYGKNSPVATNDTEEGRALNRRVEFKILAR